MWLCTLIFFLTPFFLFFSYKYAIIYFQVSIPANIYISEVATSSARCMLVTWPSLSVSVGVLLVYALGLVIQEWRTIAAISTFVPVFTAILIILCLSESPVWLLTRGREDEAERSFEWLRDIKDPNRILNEFQKEFRSVIENSKKCSVKDASQGDDKEPLCRSTGAIYGTDEVKLKQAKDEGLFSTMCSTLQRSDVWKPLVILICYFFFMQFSGIPVLLSYAVNIMISEGVSMEPYLATLILGVVKILFEIAAGFIQNRQVHSNIYQHMK